jgi:large subunit ribosomal protein L15
MADAKNAAEKETTTKAAAEKPAADKKAPAKKAPAKAAADKPAAEKATTAKKAPAKAAAPKAAAASKDETVAAKADKPAAKTPAKKAEAAENREHVLKVHHLRPAAGSKTDRTRVGRGEGSKGKTAGRGTKGTKARYSVRPGFQGGQLPLHMRAPKLRGFKNPFRVEYQVVNLEKLAELYPSGGDVTVTDLVAKGAVRKNEKVKVLGNGDIAVKLNVTVDKVSGSAEQKIVAAGGSVK